MAAQRTSLRSAAAVFAWLAAGISGAAEPGSAGTVVCGYYPSYVRGTFPAESVRFETLTHVVHAFAWPEADGRLSMDADFLYPRLIERTHGAGRKILLSLGGWGQSSGFSAMAEDPVSRAAFIRNVVRFCSDHGYDGVDIDWESPQNAPDRSHLNLLVDEFRTALDVADRSGMLLTMAIPAGDWGGQWFDYPALEPKIDWFGCMTYDFFGNWVSRAGHNAALYPPVSNNNGSVHESVQYLASDRHLQRGKILIGIPFYGRGCDATGYGAANTGGNVEYAYSEIAPKTGQGWTYRWDRTAKVPFLLNQSMTKFISYDDTQSVRLKAGYAVNEGLGGMIIWALGQDMIGGGQLLLESVGRGLRTGSGMDPDRIPVRFTLLNAYPNPFNARTMLSFTLDRQEHARLEVFNLKGEMIRVVLDEDVAAGNRRVPFDGEGLDSGTYFYRLMTPSISKTGKMTLLK